MVAARRRVLRGASRGRTAIGEADGFFGVEGALETGWIGEAVAHALVHGGKAGGAHAAKAGDLDGRRFSGEEEEVVIAHVHGEIHEDVDLVAADEVGDGGGGHADGVAPLVGERAKAIGHGVGPA